MTVFARITQLEGALIRETDGTAIYRLDVTS